MSEPILHLDWETRSSVDLKKAGLANYASHKDTGIWLASLAFDDEEVFNWFPGQALPNAVIHHIQSGRQVWAHNAPFEVAICNSIARFLGWPALQEAQMVCTMAMAYAMSLPGALEKAAPAAGIKAQKDMAGHRLMLQMAAPREVKPDGSIVWWNEVEKVQRLAAYGRQDVEVERELGKRLVQLSTQEKKVWCLDQKINKRGIRVDIPSIKKAMEIVEQEKLRLNQQVQVASGGFISTCTAVGQIKDFLEANLVVVDGVAKNDVTDCLEDKGLPDNCRKVLELRKEAAKSSTAKLSAMSQRADSLWRVRGAHQYHGAGTGRWAGRGIQIQNYPKGKYERYEFEQIFRLLHSERSRDAIDLNFGPPLHVLSNVLRSFINADPGNILRWVDFSGIEARVVAWLAGEDSVLEMFRNGADPYIHAYARAFSVEPGSVTKAQRQIGKVIVLALGFGGGVGAFQAMAKGYGVELPDKDVNVIKKLWRQTHPNIVNYWYKIENAALAAIRAKGETITVGGTAPGRLIRYKKSGSFLWCQLPSERVICYPYPEIAPVTFKHPETGREITKDGMSYMGENPKNNNKWERMKAYGGMLVENLTQATARDLLVEAMFSLEKASYSVVFHIHDEICVETSKKFGSLHEVERLASIVPHWAKDLPIVAEGDEGERYCK